MSKPVYKLLTSQRNAKNVIEHDCMSCMESWDVSKSEGVAELCRYCGSNDIRTRPGVPYNPHNQGERGYYGGADIYDQYGGGYSSANIWRNGGGSNE